MNTAQTQTKRNRSGERGSILAMSAVGMLSVLLAVGLGVDISHFYLVKSELQNAADAAALAAASAINSNPSGIVEGTTRAVKAMNNYDFNHKDVGVPANRRQMGRQSRWSIHDGGAGLNGSTGAYDPVCASNDSCEPGRCFVRSDGPGKQ